MWLLFSVWLPSFSSKIVDIALKITILLALQKLDRIKPHHKRQRIAKRSTKKLSIDPISHVLAKKQSFFSSFFMLQSQRSCCMQKKKKRIHLTEID